MSDENVALIRSAYDAFGRGDVAAVLGVMADDIDFNGPAVLPHGMQVKGREAVGGFFAHLAATWEDFAIAISDYCASGDRVCVFGRADGTLDGVKTGYGFVHAWTVRNGAAQRFDEYVDPDAELLAR
jgi:ketosteroid isomerase-like protein